jgi:hypothetical protein
VVSASAGCGDVFGGGAGRVRRQKRDHRVPHAPIGHALADLGDDSGQVEAGNVREGQGEQVLAQSRTEAGVRVVVRDSGYLYQYKASLPP